MGIASIDTLLEAEANGNRLKYLYFWSHEPTDAIGPQCLSQWYPAPFVIEGVTYPTAEHWMMAAKARLFGDAEAEAAVLAAAHPGKAKRIGREVRGFDEASWVRRREAIAVAGNVAKFGGSPQLQDYLRATGDRVLVEASATDRIWGIGMTAADPRAALPSEWLGLNLLGFALMRVRTILQA